MTKQNINIPRPIAENILPNKYDAIGYFPFVDGKELTNYQLNFANTCRQLPVGYDFITNTINKMHFLNSQGELKVENVIKDVADDYYRLTISKQTITDYLSPASDRIIRQDLLRQLQRELFYPFVKLIKPNGGFIKRFPFIFEKEDTENETVGLLLLKELFAPFVTCEYNKKKGEGFITVPAKFLPKLSLAPNDRSKDHNGKTITLNNTAIYKMHIYVMLHHNNNSSSVDLPSEDFFCNVIPELTKKDKRTNKLSLDYSQNFVETLIQKALYASHMNIGWDKDYPIANPENRRVIKGFLLKKDSVRITFDSPTPQKTRENKHLNEFRRKKKT